MSDHEIKLKIWLEDKDFRGIDKKDVLVKIEEYFELRWQDDADDILQNVFEQIGEEGRPEDPSIDEDKAHEQALLNKYGEI